MACNNKNNVILLSIGLFILSSLSQCTSLTKKFQENTISLSRLLHWHHGTLLIGLKPEQSGKSKEAKDLDLDYQSDMTWDVPGQHAVQERVFPSDDHTAVERLLKMDPTVDCSGNHMRLQVQHADSKPGALLFVDRGELSPLSLSKLPKSCGYKVSSTRRDLIMVAPYDGCFVVVEKTRYVLPLRWLGLPVQMSCPLSQPSVRSPSPPMVTCHAEGMVVKADWTSGLSEIKVNLNGNWEPLMKASPRCGFGTVEHPEGITISISYKPCIEIKEGFYSLKLLMDSEVKVLCPSLASADPPKLMMDVGLDSTPAPTQSLKTTPQVPEHPIPPSPSPTWNWFYNPYWYMQHPQGVQREVPQPSGDKVVGKPFYPVFPDLPQPDRQSPGSVPTGLDEGLGHSFYSMFYPNMPPQQAPEHPSLPDDPSWDSAYREWYMPEHHPGYPFYYPHDPFKPTPSPEVTPEPEGTAPPVYLYPVYYPTEQPESTKTTTAIPTTVPPHYQPFGPNYHPRPYPHPPHMTTTPVPSAQESQKPPILQSGSIVIFPQNVKHDTKPVECSQYCQLGLPNCCPLVLFHHHLFYLVSHDQYGNLNPHLLSLPGPPNGLRPNFIYNPSQGPQEAQAHPNHMAFSNPFVLPQLHPHGGQHERQTYNRPLEGNPAAQSENEPSEQTDNQPVYPHFETNAYFPYGVAMNPWNHQNNPEAPSHHTEYFDPVQGPNLYSPYNVQSSQQSDDPPATNILSRIQQKPTKDIHTDVKGPTDLGFHSLQDPQPVPYHTLQGDALRRTAKREETLSFASEPRDYVLLQQGPPGKHSSIPVQHRSYNPEGLASENLGHKLEHNFPNEFLNPKENLKGLEKEVSGHSDLTLGDEPGPLLETASSAGPNSAPLSHNPIRRKPTTLRFPKRPFSFGYMHRTSKEDSQVELQPEILQPRQCM